MTADAIHRAILALQRADAIAERNTNVPCAIGIRVYLLEAMRALQEAKQATQDTQARP